MKPDSDMTAPLTGKTRARKDWMGVLARAGAGRLETALAEFGATPDYEYLRRPEIGMALVRARAEAEGGRFNLGEMTVSRCSVRTGDGLVGHGYVAGRDKRHAELAAVFDALLQSPAHGPKLEATIETLAGEQTRQREERDAKTAATRVNFFTMVRGED
ncbi:MAG: phosphonate C-P lyase system protein PhnG [Desulfovibrionaceae bacterium]|nr:phosphonate C-P lyase system protein PhnG [Desulfovibrionaceae bacterium]